MTEKPNPVDDAAGELHEADTVVAETTVEPPVAQSASDVAIERPTELPIATDHAAIDDEPGALEAADLHALAALALGVAPPVSEPDIRAAVTLSPTLQRELAVLLPVADILTSLYQQPTATSPATPAQGVVQPDPPRAATPARPARVTATATTPATTWRLSRPQTLGGLSTTTAAIVGLGVLAAVAVLWALAQIDRVTARDEEIAALRQQLTELQQAANATVFTLAPASDEAGDASGAIFSSLADRTILLDVAGLPELEDDQVYQVWFQRPDSDAWELGPAFQVNDDGAAVRRVAGDTTGFTRVAISAEPGPGGAEPSGEFLLEGELASVSG